MFTKTKNILLRSLLCVMFALSAVLLVACGAPKATSLEIVSGVPTQVYQGDEIDLTNLKVKVSYSDNSNETVGINDLTYSFDSTTLGEQELVITLKNTNVKVSTTVTVIEQLPENLNLTSMFTSLQDRNGKDFVEQDHVLVAGNDNDFSLQLVATVENSESVSTRFTTTIEVERLVDGVYTEIDNLANYATVTPVDNYIKFTKQAAGEQFKITVNAVHTLITIPAVVLEVKVVDGYNVYNADQLSVISNQDSFDVDKQDNAWKTWKQAKGLYGINPSSVVLQANITVKDENIPSACFWTKEEANNLSTKDKTNQTIEGSLKDSQAYSLYKRNLSANESFAIYGNYFKINYENISKIVLDRDAGAGKSDGYGVKYFEDDEGKMDQSKSVQITTHTSLMKFEGVGSTSSVNIQDISVWGNSKRTMDVRNSGGIMLAKVLGVNSNISNCSHSNCYMGFMFDSTSNETIENGLKNKLINVKGYDSYNALIYVYGVKDLLIEGGEFLRAGGPVMIVDHVGNNTQTGEGGFPSTVNIIGTKLESFVTGNEPWFVGYNATAIVPQVTALNSKYSRFNTTYLVSQTGTDGKTVENLMNLKVVYKSSKAEGANASVVRGSVKYFNTRAEYETNTTGYALDMSHYSALASSQNKNILENSVNGAIYGATTYLIVPVDINGSTTNYVVKYSSLAAFAYQGEVLKQVGKAYQDAYIADQTNSTSETQQALAKAQQAFVEAQTTLANLADGVVDGGNVKWNDSSKATISLPSTTNLTITMGSTSVTLPSFTLDEENDLYGVKASEGVTNINFYIFNGMGIMLELYQK